MTLTRGRCSNTFARRSATMCPELHRLAKYGYSLSKRIVVLVWD